MLDPSPSQPGEGAASQARPQRLGQPLDPTVAGRELVPQATGQHSGDPAVEPEVVVDDVEPERGARPQRLPDVGCAQEQAWRVGVLGVERVWLDHGPVHEPGAEDERVVDVAEDAVDPRRVTELGVGVDEQHLVGSDPREQPVERLAVGPDRPLDDVELPLAHEPVEAGRALGCGVARHEEGGERGAEADAGQGQRGREVGADVDHHRARLFGGQLRESRHLHDREPRRPRQRGPACLTMASCRLIPRGST